MKKLLSLGLAALLAVGAAVLMMGSSAESAAPDNNTLKFDFTDDDGGFTPIFADYPNTEGVEDFYEFPAQLWRGSRSRCRERPVHLWQQPQR